MWELFLQCNDKAIVRDISIPVKTQQKYEQVTKHNIKEMYRLFILTVRIMKIKEEYHQIPVVILSLMTV